MKVQLPKVGILGLLAMASLLSASVGCAGNGAPRRWSDEPGYSPSQSTVVRKPPLGSSPNPKPVFLGGYAGASY